MQKVKRTLLQINSVVNSGSTGRIAEDLGQLAIKNDWKSFIAFGRYVRTSSSNLIKIGNEWDIKLHGIQTRLFDSHGFGSVKATKQLIIQIKQLKPDIIHLNNLHGYYLNIQVLFNYLATMNTPVIWTIYDCWPITGHCTYFDFVGCNKWETGCFNCPQKTNYPASFLIDRSRKNFKQKKELFTSLNNLTIISNSEWLGNVIKKSYLKNYPVHVINSGIDTDVFQPRKNSSIQKKFDLINQFIILGVANQWGQRKGLRDFIELSRKLDSNYQIILVGLTKKQIKALPSNIIGIEKTESVNELVEFYSLSDVFVNPTYEDNFPTTNLEALACGTPVITYRTGGSHEAIDINTGIVVEKGNINGIMDSVAQIRKIGKASYSISCINRARQYFNKNDRYQDYLSLYEKILSNK